jgi:hypothetical protein
MLPTAIGEALERQQTRALPVEEDWSEDEPSSGL